MIDFEKFGYVPQREEDKIWLNSPKSKKKKKWKNLLSLKKRLKRFLKKNIIRLFLKRSRAKPTSWSSAWAVAETMPSTT